MPSPRRPHRHRQSTTELSAAAATTITPANPDGTGTAAPGRLAPQCATLSSHHVSGPVKRISSCPPPGQLVERIAAAVPITVIGGITTATTRFAATDTRLNVPEIPAISGAVTNWAATAT